MVLVDEKNAVGINHRPVKYLPTAGENEADVLEREIRDVFQSTMSSSRKVAFFGELYGKYLTYSKQPRPPIIVRVEDTTLSSPPLRLTPESRPTPIKQENHSTPIPFVNEVSDNVQASPVASGTFNDANSYATPRSEASSTINSSIEDDVGEDHAVAGAVPEAKAAVIQRKTPTKKCCNGQTHR